jgi:hypothetical protein
MKNTLIAVLVGVSMSSAVLADKMLNNNQQLEDVVHGYGEVVGTPAEKPEPGGKYKNKGQVEDQLHGYGKVEATASEPAVIRVGKTNREQKEDAIHGYSN